jgi:soluble lytic murein transglycosylase-like protein
MKIDWVKLCIAVVLASVLFFESKESEVQIIENEPIALYGTIEYVEATNMHEWESDADFKAVDCALDVDVQEFTYYLAYGYNIDFYLLMALMEQESMYEADTISSTGDYGLMQINQCNHEWMSEELGITDFLDPYQNIMAGTYEINRLFEKYGDTNKVLMAYNMGEGGARKLWNQGIYETEYTRSIAEKYETIEGRSNND